ncbi:MAG: hypothetical protein Q9216_003032, partial [Gyalolechia sp. 2 TL-2023]
MAKSRKPSSKPPTFTAMDLDHPPPSHNQQRKPLLSAHTNAGVSKPAKSTRLPRGKGRRAQRLRKEKAGARAEEVKGRTERKVERSFGKGRRRGERN